MNTKVDLSKSFQKLVFFCSILITGASELCLTQARTQTIWNKSDSPKSTPSRLIWKMVPALDKIVAPPITWDQAPKHKRDSNQQSNSLIWEILEADDSKIIPTLEAAPKSKLNPPSTVEEFEALRSTISLQSSDFKRQHSLSLGGLTVNTALVPPDKTSMAKISYDTKGTITTSLGYSISNVVHFDFNISNNINASKDSAQSSTHSNNGETNWRGSGKAVLASPLRGAPIWNALQLSFGNSRDSINNTEQGYLFTETPFTWEASPKIAVNINPKLAWRSGSGSAWGLGISTNIQLAPRWEIIPEANIVLTSQKENNVTLGLRWNASDNVSIDLYATTASSIVDIGQLVNAGQIHCGSRFTLKL